MKNVWTFLGETKWRQKLLLGFTFVFLIYSRFYQLGSIPVSIPHDEMVYAVQAKSYVLQGTTLDQQHSPWSLKPFDHLYAELPATLMALGYLLTNNPLAGAHLTSALMGVTIPFILSYIFWNLWKNKTLSMALFVVATFNPLFWQFSRLGYDAWYSLWFYLLGTTLLTHPKEKIKWISMPIFFFGFFNYQGFKLLLFPYVLMIALVQIISDLHLWSFKEFIKSITTIFKQHTAILSVALSALALTLFFGVVLLPNQGDVEGRLNDIIFKDDQMIIDQVNLDRRQALVSPLTRILVNRPTALVGFMFDRFLSAFNLHLLFMQVEPDVSGFSVWTHGIFYWFEGILMILGVSMILSKKKTRQVGYIFLTFIPILSLPTLINSGSEWHLLRTMLSYTILIFFTAWGMYWLSRHKVLLYLSIPFYLLCIIGFYYEYFYHYPVISADWANYHERIVANYVRLASEAFPDKIISVHVAQPNYFFWSYVLYTDQIKDENIDALAQIESMNSSDNNNKYQLGNVIFSNSCNVDPKAEIFIAESTFRFCESAVSNLIENNHLSPEEHEQRSYNTLVAILDSGEKLYLLNDKLCRDFSLNNFVHPKSVADLNVEKMDRETFCTTWVTYQ